MTDSEYTPTTNDVRELYQGQLEKTGDNLYTFVDEDKANAQFDRWLAGVKRATAVKALREAADAIIADLPYGFGMKPDGTEDKEASAYAEGLHAANVTVEDYAYRIESGESA